MSTYAEKFINKVTTEYVVTGDPTQVTDRMSDTVQWNTYKGWLLKLPIVLGKGCVFMEKELCDELARFYYLPNTIVADDTQYDFSEDFFKDLLTWNTFGSKGTPKPQSSGPVINDISPISHASGMFHALKGDSEMEKLFKDIFESRAHWALADILSHLVRIKSVAPNPITGKVGDIADVTASEYEAWASSGDSSKFPVGPYLLLKIAQQGDALQKLTEDALTIQAGSTVLEVVSSFELNGDKETFARSFKMKGKQVAYSHIPLEGYLLAELFHRYYELTAKGSFMRCQLYTPKEIERARLGTFPPLFKPTKAKINGKVTEVPSDPRKALEAIAAQINAGETLKSGNADVVIDNLARMCSTYLKDAKIDTYSVTSVDLFKADMTIVNTLFEEADALTSIKEKVTLMKTRLGVASIQGAMDLLKSERQHRNVTDYTQYSYKNIASYGGNNAYPALDTMLKGERIKWFLEKCLSLDLDRVVMYGAAYAHMAQPFKGSGVHLKLLDNKPVKFSGAQVEVGDIFGIDKQLEGKDGGVVIIDDTITVKNVSESDATQLKNMYGIDVNKGQSGDWNKLQKFVLCPQHTFVSKISLSNVNESSFQRLFFPQSLPGSIVKEGPFKYVAIHKFGKFHNPEVFLTLSNDHRAPKVFWPQFQFMIASCVMSVTVANTVLQSMANTGAMCGTLTRAQVSAIWSRLLNSLPIKWPWYDQVYRTPLKYGSEILSNVDAFDLINALDDGIVDVTYAYQDSQKVVNPPK